MCFWYLRTNNQVIKGNHKVCRKFEQNTWKKLIVVRMEEGGGNEALKTNEASINSVKPNRSERNTETTLTRFQEPK